MGESVSETVSIPSLTQPGGITQFTGTILRPANQTAFPGPHPVVLLQHGLGGNQCAQWWTAQDLAGHGYIALAPASSPPPTCRRSSRPPTCAPSSATGSPR